MTSNQVGRQRIGLNPAVPSSTLFQWMADLAFRCLFVFLYVCACVYVCVIHSKSEKIGGVYFSAQKNWRKKCVNGNDKKIATRIRKS